MITPCSGVLGKCGKPCVETRTLTYGHKQEYCKLCAQYWDAVIAESAAQSTAEAITYDEEAHAIAIRAATHFKCGGYAQGLTNAPDAWTDLQPLIKAYLAAVTRYNEAQTVAATANARTLDAKRAIRDAKKP